MVSVLENIGMGQFFFSKSRDGPILFDYNDSMKTNNLPEFMKKSANVLDFHIDIEKARLRLYDC